MTSKGKVACRRPKTAICKSSVSCSFGYVRNSKYSKCVQPIELFYCSPGQSDRPSELKQTLSGNSSYPYYNDRCGQPLERPTRRMTVNCGSRPHIGTVPLRNQKAAPGMRFRPLLVAMVMTQRVLNLLHCLNPFFTRLPLPEHYESLSAHAAMCLCISTRTLA